MKADLHWGSRNVKTESLGQLGHTLCPPGEPRFIIYKMGTASAMP